MKLLKSINEYIFLLVIIIIFTCINRSFEIVIIKSQFLIESHYSQSQEHNESLSLSRHQTIHLLNKTDLSIPKDQSISIVESIPSEVARSFDLYDDDDGQQVYLTFRNRTKSLIANCVLLLSNDIAVNVSFTERYSKKSEVEINENDDDDGNGLINDDDEDDIVSDHPNQQARFAVDYIFKLSNRSRFGLIKDDTPVNGILCIVRIFDTFTNQTDLDQVDLRIGSDYFQVKRFQKQFYMVQLVKTREVFRIDRLFEVTLEAFRRSNNKTVTTATRIGTCRVRFLVVRSQDLEIRLPNALDLDVVEDDSNVWRAAPYGGRYLTRIQAHLARNAFLDDSAMERYIQENVRFRIIGSNFPAEKLVEIDYQKGILSVCANKTLDREEIGAFLLKSSSNTIVKLWYNITVFDKRKLFRPNSLLVQMRLLDLNDNAPKFERDEFNIDLDLNTIHTTHESAFISGKHYFLVFNRTASDADADENATLTYFLHSVRADNQRFVAMPKFFVPVKTGQLWVSLDAFFSLLQTSPRSVYFYHVRVGCKDRANRFSIVDVHIRMNFTTYDEYKTPMSRQLIGLIEPRCFYFDLDVEQLIELGQIRVGYVPIRLPVSDSMNSEIQPLEMSDDFGMFFNLSISRDGLVRVLLSRRFYENRDRLKTLNHLTSRFSFVTARNEVRSVIVYFKFLSSDDQYKFKKSLYEFTIAENEINKNIGVIETNCSSTVEEIRIISNTNFQFNPNRLLNASRSSSDVVLSQLAAFDYETERNYDLWIVGKCGGQSLISTRVRLSIVDRNDNQPQFVQPIRELNQTFQFTLAYSKLDDYALVQLKAVDFDESEKFAQIKYSIVDNRLIDGGEQHKLCNELTNLTIYLDESNGWLYIGRSSNSEPLRRSWCDVEFRLKAVAVNYVENEISDLVEFGLKLRVLFSGESKSTFTWIIHNKLDWRAASQPVATYDSSLAGWENSPENIQIEKCWLNQDKRPMRDEFYMSLNWPQLYFYERRLNDDQFSNNVTRIECKLSETKPLSIGGGGSLKRPNSWLVLDLTKSVDLPRSLPNTIVYIELDKSDVLKENSHVTKFDYLSLIESNLEELMLVYRMNENNENIISKLFKLDPFTGELRTTKLNKQMKNLLKTVNLLSMEIDILILKIEQASHRLLKRYSFSVYANLTTSHDDDEEEKVRVAASQLLDECIDGLDAKLLRKTVRTLENRLLRVVQLNQSAESLSYQIESVHAIDLDSPELDRSLDMDVHPFEFDQNNQNTYLVFNLDTLLATQEKRRQQQPFNLFFYLIQLRICLQQATVENDLIFSRRCKIARFNVEVGFKIGLDELKFQAEKFTFTYFSIGEFHLDTSFNFIDSTRPLVDVKTLLNSSHLFDIERLIRSNVIKFHLDPSSQFYLDAKNGYIFTPNLNVLNQSRDLSVDLYLEKQASISTKTKITLRIKRIESPQTINLEIESSRLKLEWVNVFKLALFDRIRFELFKTFDINVKCTNLEVRLCSSLFKFNKITGYLLMHATKLFDPSVYFLVAERTVKLIVEIGLPNNNRLTEIELNLNVKTRENEVEEPIGGEVARVQLINTTEASLRIELVSKWALENSTSLEVVRVKNMLTNNQVLALGYRIDVDSHDDVYYLELDDVLSMELNQLYAFDFAARDRISSQSSPLVSIYFLRFNPYYSSEVDAVRLVKFYANVNGRESVGFNLTKIQLDYLTTATTTTTTTTTFSQNIYLINRIKSNRFAAKSNLLRRYFKLESDMLYFDTSQLVDIELFGDSLEISLFKFVSDKLSLKVVRIVEFQIIIETFDETDKQAGATHLPSYYKSIQLTKTELINQMTWRTSHLGYNYLLVDFGIEYPTMSRFALSYDQEDLPFEIEKSSGRLYYLPSEDTTEFDSSTGEKRFNVNVKLIDSALNEIDFFVDVRLIDDDELVYTDDGLISKFYIRPNTSKDELVGQIRVLEVFENHPEKNLTHYVEFFSRNRVRFEFEIVDSDDYEHLFRLDRNTGLLFTNKSIVRLGEKFKKLGVKVVGKVAHKSCYFLIDVYIFMRGQHEAVTAIGGNAFESNELYVNITLGEEEEYFEPKVKLTDIDETVFNSNLRYKLLQNRYGRCEINWYNGKFKCRSGKETDKERFSVLIASYNLLENNEINNIGLTKVNIDVAKSRKKVLIPPQQRKQQIEATNKTQEIPTISIKLTKSLKIGETFVKLYDLVENLTNLNPDSSNIRVYLIETNSSSSSSPTSSLISSYFSLNSLSSELALKNTLLESRLSQVAKFIQGKLVQFVRIDLEIEEKCLFSSRLLQQQQQQQQDETSQEYSIELNLKYSLLKYKSSIKLAKIYNYDPNFDYFIELINLNKSISNGYDLALTTNIQIVKSVYSLISIEGEYLVLNSEKFLERNLVQFEYTVLKLVMISADNKDETTHHRRVLDRIEARINYKLVITFDENFDTLAEYMGYNRLDIDLQLDVSSTRIGDVVFDLNRTLLNGLHFSNLLLILSEPDLPFAVDLASGNLIISHYLSIYSDRVYEFSLALTEKFHIRFKIHAYRVRSGQSKLQLEKGLSEVQRLKLANYCQENHFIGSINNLPEIDDVRFEFNLIGKSNLVKLNSSSGELFCSGEVAKFNTGFFETLEIQVTWIGGGKTTTTKNPSFYYKTILLYLEIYKLLGSYNEPNEKLIFELKIPRISLEVEETKKTSQPIWTIPEVISQQYDSCLIISGNHGSRFHINRSYQLIYEPPESSSSSESFYRLLMRCFSPKLAEVDLELDTNIIYIDQAVRRKQFDYKSLNEVDINVESFRLDKPLVNLDAEKKLLRVRYELIQPKSGLSRFFASLIKVDEQNGDVHLDINSFNRYLQYCEFGGGGGGGMNQRLSILVGVKIYNETNHAIAMLKLNPNCDRTNLNLRFKKPFYIVQVRDIKPNKLIESMSLVDELRNSYTVEYQFCSHNNDDSLMRIDEKTGQIYWNSMAIIDEIGNEKKLEEKICARLKNSQSKSLILIETDLILRMEKKTDDLKPIIRVFNSDLPNLANSSIILTLPLNTIVSSRKSNIKLFKFNTNLSLVTSSSNIFRIDDNDGWLILKRDSLVPETQIHYLHVSTDASNKLDMIIKLDGDKNCGTIESRSIDLFVPIATKSGSKLIDLKRFLCFSSSSGSSDEFKYLIAVDKSKRVCNECVYYNQHDGHLYLAKEIDTSRLLSYEFKLTSESNDLTLIELNLNFYKDDSELLNNKPAKIDDNVSQLIEIYVSIETKIGSIIYDSSGRNNNNRIITSFTSIDNTYFELVDGKILLAKNLTNLSHDHAYFEIDFGGGVGLRIYIIETIQPKFIKPVYYVKYEAKLADLEMSSRRLTSVELSPKSVLKLLSVESTQITIRCVEGGYKIDSKLGLFHFEVASNGELFFLDANTRTIVEQTCEIFELSIDLKLESIIKSATTKIFIEMSNLAEMKFLTPFRSTSSENYYFNRAIKTPSSISIFETLGIEKDQCEFRIILIRPLSMLDIYEYEPDKGVLTFNSLRNIRHVEFDVICFKNEIIARKFHLNVHLVSSNESVVYFFEKQLFKIDLEISQLFISSSKTYQTNTNKNSLIVFDLKEKLIDARSSTKRDWSNSGIILKHRINSSLIVSDDLNGLLQLNETLLSRFRLFLNFSCYFHIQACFDDDDDNCRSASIELNIRSLPLRSQTDYFKEFYAGFTFTDDSMMKLRKFGFEGGYRLYKSRNELVTIDYSNGLVSTFDERDFVVVYNETYPVAVTNRKKSPLNEELTAENETIYIDFVYDVKSSLFGTFLMNLDKSISRRRRRRYGCEFWSPFLNNVTLDQNCNLFIRADPNTTKSLMNLRARLFDTFYRHKSKFINVNLNLTSSSSSSNYEFIPFYKLTHESNNNKWRQTALVSDYMISNSIKFNRLSFVAYERFNLTFEGYLTLRLMFRSDSKVFNSNLLAYLLLGVNRDIYFVSVETIGCNLELRHNLTIKSTTTMNRIRVDYDLISNVWYYVQIQMTEKEFAIELKQYKQENSIISKKLRLKNFVQEELIVHQLYIGGMDDQQSPIDSFYSDDIEIADVRLNNYELFDAETIITKRARLLLDEDASSKICSSECFRPLTITNEVNYTLEMKMKPTYKRYLELIEQGQQGQNNLTLIFGLNFTMARLNPPYQTQIVLIRSRRSLLVLNLLLKRIELRSANRVRAWIHFNTTQDITSSRPTYFTLISRQNKTQLKLNNHMVEFEVVDSKEIFTSNTIRIESAQTAPSRISICLQAIYINNDRLALNRGQSKSYTNDLFTNDEASLIRQSQCSPSFLNTFEQDQNDDVNIIDNKNFNLITETVLEDEEIAKTPSTIIITVVISSVIAFVAMLSILANIYLRNVRFKEQDHHHHHHRQQGGSGRGASLKMNSRQEFEISLNFSSQNSPVSSEICSLSTNHSFNPFTATAMATTTTNQNSFIGRVQSRSKSNDECLLNCLNLNSNHSRGQQTTNSDYFEYDAFKMGELTPHAEFIFKKVNLNRKTATTAAATENIEKTINIESTSSSDQTTNTLSFERQDFDKLRHVLNWEPSYSQYEDVFDDFQRYVGSRKHVCNRCERHIDLEMSNSNNNNTPQMILNSGSVLMANNNFTSSSNFYDEFDKHTFV